MNTLKNETGNIYNRLTVIGRAPNGKFGQAMWVCLCSCGNKSEVAGGNLRNGHIKSCGCGHKDAITKHGMGIDPIFGVWRNMCRRVLDPTASDFSYYGGRGVKVCNEWLQFKPFYDWAKDKWEQGLELDRKDANGDYTPKNCRFVSSSDNMANRRLFSNNTSGYTGVIYIKELNKCIARLDYKPLGGRVIIGYFSTPKEAAIARNDFIIGNNLPHKLQEII